MSSGEINPAFLILLVGGIIVSSIFLKSIFGKIGVPALVGFIALGFLIRTADTQIVLLSEEAEVILEFLAKIGVIALLFRIGLESHVSKLFGQLRRASLIWVGDVVCSGALGFVASYLLFGIALIPSLFIATALTATSVGVSVGVWHEAGAAKSSTGETLIDVAELDDISGIVLMAVLFAVVPALTGESEKSISIIVVTTIGLILLKLAIFGTLCFLFSIHLEERITTFFQRIESAPDFMLTVVALGFIISALAAMLGFSVAIGAFFAGLIFSRDPASVKIGASFDPIYELFSPFFFIGIGLSIQPGAVIDGLGLGLLLLIIAVTGKFIGDGLGAFFSIGKTAAILLGVSMIPRAEIAMIIMKHGVNLGDWAVPPRVFSGMVFVSAMTCVCIPFCVRLLLRKWPQTEEG